MSGQMALEPISKTTAKYHCGRFSRSGLISKSRLKAGDCLDASRREMTMSLILTRVPDPGIPRRAGSGHERRRAADQRANEASHEGEDKRQT